MLLQIVQQLAGGNKSLSIKWQAIHVAGRTPRALQEQWVKIREDNAANINNQGPPGVPQARAPRTPGGKKAKAKATGTGE
jgi:hypothetical protein